MVDKVINLVITMYQRAPVLGLRCGVAEKGDHVIKMWYFAYWLLSIDINGLRLRFGDGSQCSNLPVVEARRLSEAGQTYRLGNNAVKFG